MYVVKTWTEYIWKQKGRNSLLEHFIRTLDWIFVYLYTLEALYPFSYTVCLSCLIIKLGPGGGGGLPYETDGDACRLA